LRRYDGKDISCNGLEVQRCSRGQSSSALAQTYPNQPVKILLPYGAGGVADITARVVAQELSQSLGQQVLIENRPSAGQVVATEAVMKAEPDGYTLLWFKPGPCGERVAVQFPALRSGEGFRPISTVGFFRHGSRRRRKIAVQLAAGVDRRGKGESRKLNVGTTSPGGTQYIAAELFKSMAGLDSRRCRSRRRPSSSRPVKTGDVQAMVEILAPMIPQNQERQPARARSDFRPSLRRPSRIPTIAEAGVRATKRPPGTAWLRLWRTPKAIIDRLNREINAAVGHRR